MRTIGTTTLVALLVLTGAACGGKKDAQQTAGQAGGQQAAQSQGQRAGTSGSPQDIAQGLKQFTQQMQEMQKGPDGKSYDPVDFKALQALLPDLPGWEKGKSTGERMTAPFAHSTAKVDYTRGDASIEIDIMDSVYSQMALMPVQMLLGAKFSRETDTGYEKSVSIGDQPGFEKWDKEAKSGEISIIAGGRYIVNIKGNGIDSTSVLHDVAGKLDIGKLAGMK